MDKIRWQVKMVESCLIAFVTELRLFGKSTSDVSRLLRIFSINQPENMLETFGGP